MSFKEQFNQHTAWQQQLVSRLHALSGQMGWHDLLDPTLDERLQRLEDQILSDKVTVAFVAEFSRGKSELINALFFADYGRRIMPAGSGRTTMCPTELSYDEDMTPCLRLLPIETRLQPQSLAAWRGQPEQWTRIELDINDPVQLAQTLEKVSEVRRVTREEAQALGFWSDEITQGYAQTDANGLVEVPTWRHALVNIEHPLLKQGLVILDTPGLNAIGAEPELTVNLIAQAHAVVFILAADTGVTQSDLAIWREHLSVSSEGVDTRLVALNKIDTLWDPLSSPEQVQAQIEQQKTTTTEILGLSPSQVIAVSAQKGLLAKVQHDPALLRASCLGDLELALGQGLVNQRQKISRAAVTNGVVDLRSEALHAIHLRRRNLAEQLLELHGLRGKSAAMLEHLRQRIEREQTAFEASSSKLQAVRTVHLKLLQDVLHLLSTPVLKSNMSQLRQALAKSGLKFGVKQAYVQAFERLRDGLHQANLISDEILAMLSATFVQLNGEFGFSLEAPKRPQLDQLARDLEKIEASHLRYLGMSNLLKLSQPEFCNRLMQALATRLAAVYELALNDIDLWNRSCAAQLDDQLRERKRNFAHRLSSIERVRQAANSLDEHIAEVEGQESTLNVLEGKVMELTAQMLASSITPQEVALSPSAAHLHLIHAAA